MKCPCSRIPRDLKVIKVGESEVGIHDLRKILREVYRLGIEDDQALKEELLKRVKEKNYISEKREELYAEALMREYRAYARTQWPEPGPRESMNKEKEKKIISFWKRLFGARSVRE